MDYITDIINIVAVTIFGVEHRFNDGFTYGQAGILYYTLLGHFLIHMRRHFGLRSARPSSQVSQMRLSSGIFIILPSLTRAVGISYPRGVCVKYLTDQ